MFYNHLARSTAYHHHNGTLEEFLPSMSKTLVSIELRDLESKGLHSWLGLQIGYQSQVTSHLELQVSIDHKDHYDDQTIKHHKLREVRL